MEINVEDPASNKSIKLIVSLLDLVEAVMKRVATEFKLEPLSFNLLFFHKEL
jgi:hypothetical protein